MGEEKISNFKLKKSYMGYMEGTVGQAVERGDRIVLLLKGSSFPVNKALFDALKGDVYETVDEKPTVKDPEPPQDPEDSKPVDPAEGKEEPAVDTPEK